VPEGYFAMPSGTYTGFALLRSNLKSGSEADIAKAVAYGKRIKFYPLSQATNPPPTKFVDSIDIVFDSTIPYDLRFFQTLDRFVQREPWYGRDRVMIDQLKTIGIEKGKPFNPDAGTQRILSDAAREAHDWLDLKYQGHFATPYNEGSRWALPADPDVLGDLQTNFARPDAYPVDGRGVGYSIGYFSTKHLGTGQFALELVGHSDEISERLRLHLTHDVTAMKFHGLFGHPQHAGYLFVQESEHDFRHHLAFSRRKGMVKGAQVRPFHPLRGHDAVSLDSLADCIEQILFAEGLGKKFDGPGLHCLNGHRNVAVARDKDDRYLDARLAQLSLQIKAAQSRQPHVEHHARRNVCSSRA
jgi:hypothetical protein